MVEQVKDHLKIISKSLLFQGLSKKDLRKIEQISVIRMYAKGEIVFGEDEKAEGFYIVETGTVKVFKVSSEGKEQILHIFGPGEPLGEVAVFSGDVFPASAECITKCRLLFFPRTGFVDLISANPSLALNMLAVLSMRLRRFTVQIENLSLKEVPGRLAAYLLLLSEEQGTEGSVLLPISKGQLASLLGTVPETLSRILANMKGEGIIDVKDRTIRLLDRGRLEDLAVSGRYIQS